MSRHLTIVSTTFTVSGALLGLLSSVSFLWLMWAALRMDLAKPAEVSDGSVGPDSLVNLLVAGGRIFGKIFSFLAGAGQALILFLAVMVFFTLCLALFLMLVGRGLYKH